MQLQAFIESIYFKDKLRTFEAQFPKKLRTTEAHFELTGPYKKQSPAGQRCVHEHMKHDMHI